YTSGAAASSPTYDYVYASYIDEPVMRSGSGGNRYYHRNQQYSITALTDSSGTIKERYAYDAYGNLSVFDGSGTARTATAEGNRYTYTGREWDDELSLYHYRARMYDPMCGRFCSRDPIGFRGSAHNLYQFIDSDPLASTDPSGLVACKCQVTFSANLFYKKKGKWVPDDPASIGPYTAGSKPFFGVATCSLAAKTTVYGKSAYGLKKGGVALGKFDQKFDISVSVTCYKKPCPCNHLTVDASLTNLDFWFVDAVNSWGKGVGTYIYGGLFSPKPANFHLSSIVGPAPNPVGADCTDTIKVPISDGLPLVYGVSGNVTVVINVF
ncbi:RHS repeat-associated core domain-containing protein, partial [Rhodopirellula sp. MGV]|uniref:RHS repeat-associated core domain-containing protein n=1 Tax=Rhodopirellula sp. MGV TaxID=2023130 RepID=UPI00117A3162